MKTDQLITLLSGDDVIPRPVALRMIALGGVALLSGVLVVGMVVDMRSGLLPALMHPVTAMKWLLPFSVALSALAAALRLTHPQRLRAPVISIAAVIGAGVAVWLLVVFIRTPPAEVVPGIMGTSRMACVSAIVSISLVPLALVIRVLRDGASTAPALTGGFAGLAVGGFATTAYALFCTEDAPLFFLVWYSLAILSTGVIGALAGHRYLQW